jgi:hypothetical protein
VPAKLRSLELPDDVVHPIDPAEQFVEVFVQEPRLRAQPVWGGEKISKHSAPASDVSGLASVRRAQAQGYGARTGRDFPIIVILEAAPDGFWVLQSEGIESHVVDAPRS